jgi:hypothetical protein
LVVPPSICQTVRFKQFQPAYTVNNLTLAYLTSFGLPAIRDNITVAIGVALDVLSRYTNIRIMNDTESFCEVDEQLRDWCGVNTSSAFAYCVVSETWPQYDVWGWLENTTFTGASSSLSSIFPALCMCPVAGRAYYLPVGSIDNRAHYSSQCSVETTLLAFYIMLILLYVAVFLYVAWDMVLYTSFVVEWRQRTKMGSIFIVKLAMLCFFLLAIPCMIVFAVPSRGNNAMFIVAGVLNIFVIALVYYAFAQSIFSFMEILVRVEFFKRKFINIAMDVFRWLFFVCTVFFTLSMIGIISVLSYYTDQLASFNVANVTELGVLVSELVAPLARALVMLIIITQGVTLVISAVLLCGVGVMLFRLKSLHKLKELIVRFVGLCVALMLGVPEMAMLIMVCYFVGWVSFGPNPSPWDSFYLTVIANAWFQWALFASQLLWISSIAYAMRTKVKQSWLVGRFRSMLSAITSRTGGDSEFSGGDSSTDATPRSNMNTSMNTNEFTFKGDD